MLLKVRDLSESQLRLYSIAIYWCGKAAAVLSWPVLQIGLIVLSIQLLMIASPTSGAICSPEDERVKGVFDNISSIWLYA